LTSVFFTRLNSVEIDQAGRIGGDMRLPVLSRRHSLRPLFCFFLTSYEKNRRTVRDLPAIIALRNGRYQPLTSIFYLKPHEHLFLLRSEQTCISTGR